MESILSFDLGMHFQFSWNGREDVILKLENKLEFQILAEKLIKRLKPDILVVEWNSGFSGGKLKHRFLWWQHNCVDLCKKYNVKLQKIHVAEWKHNYAKMTGLDVTSYAFKKNDAKHLYKYFLSTKKGN